VLKLGYIVHQWIRGQRVKDNDAAGSIKSSKNEPKLKKTKNKTDVFEKPKKKVFAKKKNLLMKTGYWCTRKKHFIFSILVF